MEVFVNIPLRGLRCVRGLRASTYFSGWMKAVRLIGPVDEKNERRGCFSSFIHADVALPDGVAEHAAAEGFQKDGSYRARVRTDIHRKTLAAFLASGDMEWDVRDL